MTLPDVSETYFEQVRWVAGVPVAPTDTLVLLRELHERIGALIAVFELRGIDDDLRGAA